MTTEPTRSIGLRDSAKPLALIAAVLVGLGLNWAFDGALAGHQWIVQVGLFVVVFSIMAFVEIGAIGGALTKRTPTALAIATNYLAVPALAWSLGWVVLRNHPDLWAGVVLYSLTPCIGWYLIFIDLARGNMAWGLALLPIDVVLQTALLPVYLWFLVGRVVPIDVVVLVRSVGLFLLAPFALASATRAVLARWRGPAFTNGLYKRAVGRIKTWALVAVITAIFATQPTLSASHLTDTALIIATITAFFVALFALALGLGRLFGLDYPDTTTLVFEVSARNSESVIGVAAIAFPGRPLVVLAIVLGPVVELPVLLALARMMLSLRTRWPWPRPRSRAPLRATTE